MPTTSAGAHREADVRDALGREVPDLEHRWPGLAVGAREQAPTSRPTIIRISARSLVSAVSTVPTCRPSRRTVMRSLRSRTSARRCET